MDNFFALNYGISFDNFFQSPAHLFPFLPILRTVMRMENHSQHTFCCDPLVSECASEVFPNISRYSTNAILRRPSAKPATIAVEIRNPKLDSGTIPFGVRSLRLWDHFCRDPESKIRFRSHSRRDPGSKIHSRRDPGKYVKNISLVREKNRYY
jgi:hypothetical protein